MHAAMDRLERLTARHGRIVLILWVLILLASLPFAARQTDNLTSGGFAVPGSGSDAVDRGLAAFDRGGSQQLAAVVARRDGASDADVRAGVDRVGRAADKVSHVALPPRAAAEAKRKTGEAAITVVPLTLDGDRDQSADAATDMRDELGLADGTKGSVE